MADWLDPDVPTVWRSSLLHLIKVTPNITWLMVTRSPEHWRRLLEECRKMPQNEIGLNSSGFTEWIDRWLNGQPPANVWMGSVIRNPAKLEDRMNNFLQIPARLRFLFALPTQGDLDLSPWMKEVCVKCGKPRSEVERHYNPTTKEISDTPTGMSQCSGCGQVYRNSDVSSHYKQPFQWLVCDGAGAPVPAERVRSLRDQCLAKRLPFFFVGWGEWTNGILDTEKNKLALQDGRIIFPDPVSMDIWKWEAGSDSDPQNHVLEVSARLRYNVSSPAQREAWRSANNRLLDGVEYLEFPTLAQKENDAAKMHASRFPFKLH
jgi:protein gp37